MSSRSSAVLAAFGAVLLLTLGSLALVGAAQGRFGSRSVLTLDNCGPRNPTGAVVNVNLTDRGGAMMGGGNAMMVTVGVSPTVVASGTVTFVATNTGALNHELLVLPAPRDGVGTRAVDSGGKIDEVRSVGEASRSCSRGVGPGITPGTRSWVTLHLTPGRYELLCDEPWHYANGMFTRFTVQ